jgi:hypothetical protein
MDILDVPTSLAVNGSMGLLLGASFGLAQDTIAFWRNRWWAMLLLWCGWAAVIAVASLPRFEDLHGRRIVNSMVALWLVFLLLRHARKERCDHGSASEP